MKPILILRPEPGASETAAKARALGLQAHVSPIFTVRAVEWSAPDPAAFDAVLLTSANAARHGGSGLQPFTHLPCYTAGEASAAAARDAGFGTISFGASDGAAALALAAADGFTHLLHFCGHDHVVLALSGQSVGRRIVYAADAARALPSSAQAALAAGAVVLLHSPRAAALFAGLVGDRREIDVAAISRVTAVAAGEGWRAKAVAETPRDEALLELAAKLCQTGDRPQEAGRNNGNGL